MKIYNLNKVNFTWLEDTSFIGFSTCFINDQSYFVIDIDINIQTKYESDTFVSYISPAKLVLKNYADVDFSIKSLFGKNSVQNDPFIIKKLEVSNYMNGMLIFTFKLIGDGSFVIYAMGGRLFVPDDIISIKGQKLYIPSEKREKLIAKHFKIDFFVNKKYWN